MNENKMVSMEDIKKDLEEYDKWYYYIHFERNLWWIILLALFVLIFNDGWVLSIVLFFYMCYGLNKKHEYALKDKERKRRELIIQEENKKKNEEELKRIKATLPEKYWSKFK